MRARHSFAVSLDEAQVIPAVLLSAFGKSGAASVLLLQEVATSLLRFSHAEYNSNLKKRPFYRDDLAHRLIVKMRLSCRLLLGRTAVSEIELPCQENQHYASFALNVQGCAFNTGSTSTLNYNF